LPKEPEAGTALPVPVAQPLPKEPEAGAGPLPKEPEAGAGPLPKEPEAGAGTTCIGTACKGATCTGEAARPPRTGFQDLPKDEGDGAGPARFLLKSKEAGRSTGDCGVVRTVEPKHTGDCGVATDTKSGTARFLLNSKEAGRCKGDCGVATYAKSPGHVGCPTGPGEPARCDAAATICRSCGAGLSCRGGLSARRVCVVLSCGDGSNNSCVGAGGTTLSCWVGGGGTQLSCCGPGEKQPLACCMDETWPSCVTDPDLLIILRFCVDEEVPILGASHGEEFCGVDASHDMAIG